MVVFDLASEPWFTLLVIGVLALVMVGLFLGMRRAISKIRVPERDASEPERRENR